MKIIKLAIDESQALLQTKNLSNVNLGDATGAIQTLINKINETRDAAQNASNILLPLGLRQDADIAQFVVNAITDGDMSGLDNIVNNIIPSLQNAQIAFRSVQQTVK